MELWKDTIHYLQGESQVHLKPKVAIKANNNVIRIIKYLSIRSIA